MKKIIKDRPDICYKSNNVLNGFIFFENDDGILHCFNPNGDSLKMFYEMKAKAAFILKEEEKELELLKKSFSSN